MDIYVQSSGTARSLRVNRLDHDASIYGSEWLKISQRAIGACWGNDAGKAERYSRAGKSGNTRLREGLIMKILMVMMMMISSNLIQQTERKNLNQWFEYPAAVNLFNIDYQMCPNTETKSEPFYGQMSFTREPGGTASAGTASGAFTHQSAGRVYSCRVEMQLT